MNSAPSFAVGNTTQSHNLIFNNPTVYDGENFMQAQINNLSQNKHLAKNAWTRFLTSTKWNKP
jgi:hypothetical protein